MARHGRDAADPSPTGGELLRRYRELAGLTQAELGAKTGYSADYIRKLERDRRRLPPAALDRLATALGLEKGERATLETALNGAGPAGAAGLSPLAGRADEVAAVHRLLAGLGPPVLLLAGEPGIGKTRLLEETAALAAQSGWGAVRGGCQRRAQDPFDPVTAALADSLARLPAAERDAVLRRSGRLDLLLPELDPPAHPAAEALASRTPPRPEQERRLLVASVRAYLQAVAGEKGTVLILDDLQWAGPDALDLLTALAAAAPGGAPCLPLRVIGAYRDSEAPAGAPLQNIVADLARASSLQVLTLQPLSREESTRLVSRLLPADDDTLTPLVPVIVRRAEGVPLFLISFVQELRRHGGSEPQLDLPWDVAQVIQQRVVALPEVAQEVLGVAALVGRTVSLPLLLGVTGHSEDAVLAALEAAAASRLLDEDGELGYRFSHDLIRETVEHDLSAGRRRVLHRRIGDALAQLPARKREGRAAEIAWHFQLGDDPERALHWTLQAGDRAAALFAPGDAARHYRAAAELARELDDERAEVQALDRLGDVLYRAGNFRASAEALERAAAIYERLGYRDRSLEVVARASESHGWAGQAAEGIGRVRAAIESEEGRPQGPESLRLADLYAALSSLYHNALRFGHALEAAERALSLAEATGNLRALCTAEVARGLALRRVGRAGEMGLAFRRAAEVAERLGDPFLQALAVFHLGVAALEVDDVVEGERQTRRALDIVDRAGLVGWSTFARQSLATLLVAHGRWAEARVEAERAVDEKRSLGSAPGSAYPLITLGRILLLQGERERGLRSLQEALAVATEYSYLPGVVGAQEALAWQAVRESRPEEAVARLEPLLAAARAAGLPWSPTVYTRAQIDLGNEERAAELLAAARERVVSSPSRLGLPEILLQSARLANRQGRRSDAGRDLAEGLAIARDLELPYEEALLLEEKSRLVAGDVTQASLYLEEALAILRRLGAVPDIQRIEGALKTPP